MEARYFAGIGERQTCLFLKKQSRDLRSLSVSRETLLRAHSDLTSVFHVSHASIRQTVFHVSHRFKLAL